MCGDPFPIAIAQLCAEMLGRSASARSCVRPLAQQQCQHVDEAAGVALGKQHRRCIGEVFADDLLSHARRSERCAFGTLLQHEIARNGKSHHRKHQQCAKSQSAGVSGLTLEVILEGGYPAAAAVALSRWKATARPVIVGLAFRPCRGPGSRPTTWHEVRREWGTTGCSTKTSLVRVDLHEGKY